MNDLKLKIYHPDLDLISDRTLRFLLKKIGSISRSIQAAEVLELINLGELSASEKQSLRDRVAPELPHIPAYYVEHITRGSLEVVVTLTALGIWLLQTTIGKSLEEAWKQTRMHEQIIEYLTSNKRRIAIEKNIDGVVGNWPVDRYVVDRIEKTIDSNGDITVALVLKTPPQLQATIKEVEKIDVDFVVKQGQKRIAEINPPAKGTGSRSTRGQGSKPKRRK